jgi:hypothetical protein
MQRGKPEGNVRVRMAGNMVGNVAFPIFPVTDVVRFHGVHVHLSRLLSPKSGVGVGKIAREHRSASQRPTATIGVE